MLKSNYLLTWLLCTINNNNNNSSISIVQNLTDKGVHIVLYCLHDQQNVPYVNLENGII